MLADDRFGQDRQQAATDLQIAEAMAAELESLGPVAAATDLDADPIKVENMRGWLLADGLIMLKYTSENRGRRSNRTSLWRRAAAGRWQIFHHQGTLAAG